MYTGPHIIKDGLVFGYDTGYGTADNNTATRFYAGKTVDNEFYNSGANGNILSYSSGYGGIGTAQSGVLDAFGTRENTVYRKTGKIRFGPTGGQDIGTLVYGNTYTFSIYLRHVSGETQMSGGEFDIVDQSSGGKNFTGSLSSNMTYEWKRFSVTSTHTNSSNYHFIDIGIYQGTGVFEWCMPQIEQGTVMSPFTSTSRSSTQSLIDLKGTTDIDVSNVTFDSTGQPTFDGTDDYISLPNDLGYGTTSVSVFAWFKINGNSPSGGYHIICGPSYLEMSIYAANPTYLRNGVDTTVGRHVSNNGNQTLNDGNYHYYGFTFDGSTKIAYIDGVQVGTQSVSGTLNNSFSGRMVGNYGNSYYALGDIPVYKVYNKVLTATEIKQNFNAYKNRFSI